MSEDFSRPFDYLESLNGEDVIIDLMDGRTVWATQVCFDQHSSVLLEDVTFREDGETVAEHDRYFLRGSNIQGIRGVVE